jgi:hypothetical protein
MVVRSLLFYTIFLLVGCPLSLFCQIWQVEVSIDNIDCPICVERVEKKLISIPGVDKCKLIESISLAKITWKKDVPFSAAIFWEKFFETPFQIRELTLDVDGVLSQKIPQKSLKEQKVILTLLSKPDQTLFYIENPNFKALRKFKPGQKVLLNGRVVSKQGWNFLEVREAIAAIEEDPVAPPEEQIPASTTVPAIPQEALQTPKETPATTEKAPTTAPVVPQEAPKTLPKETPATVEKAPATAPVAPQEAPKTLPKETPATVEKAPATAPVAPQEAPKTLPKETPATAEEAPTETSQEESQPAKETPKNESAPPEQDMDTIIKAIPTEDEAEAQEDDLLTIFKGDTSSP